jgi:hypothetical protein
MPLGSLVPRWTYSADADLLVSLIAVQRWSRDSSGDREVVEKLTGLGYSTIEDRLRILAKMEEPPIRLLEHMWSWDSPFDAWRLLQDRMTEEILRRFHDEVPAILMESDPAFDIPPTERWHSFFQVQKKKYSRQLRQGLADSLALFTHHGAFSPPGERLTPRIASTSITRSVLHGIAGDERRWFSLKDIVERIAEANPGEFLQACELDIASAHPALPSMYVVSKTSFMTSSPHVHFLWALEKISWLPAHLSRSADILLYLSQREPAGNYGNKASNSLKEIFTYWYGNTGADSTRKLKAVDHLRDRYPDPSWKLMIDIAFNTHHVSGLSRPKWATWATGLPREVSTEEAQSYRTEFLIA